MPKTIQITNVLDLHMLRMFNQPASERLIKAFNEGKKIERIESSFEDYGTDYTAFTVDGEEICTVPGY